jgi:hypothetical protein
MFEPRGSPTQRGAEARDLAAAAPPLGIGDALGVRCRPIRVDPREAGLGSSSASDLFDPLAAKGL